jgi:hypothetical protein
MKCCYFVVRDDYSIRRRIDSFGYRRLVSHLGMLHAVLRQGSLGRVAEDGHDPEWLPGKHALHLRRCVGEVHH